MYIRVKGPIMLVADNIVCTGHIYTIMVRGYIMLVADNIAQSSVYQGKRV